MADADSWLIDTSIVVDILRGHSPAKDWVDTLPEEGRFVSVVTAAELVAGCRNQAEQRRSTTDCDWQLSISSTSCHFRTYTRSGLIERVAKRVKPL